MVFPLKYEKQTEQMVSSVYCRIGVAGTEYEDTADIRQKVGSRFEHGNLVVEPGDKAREYLDEEAFIREARNHYRDQLYGSGDGMLTMGAPADFTEDTIFDKDRKVEIPEKEHPRPRQ
jgi:hypothetical protein